MLFLVLVLATFAYILGIGSRLASVVIFVLLVSFNERTPSAFSGADNVLRILAFFAMFLETGKAYVPAWYRKWKGVVLAEKVPGWPVRMIQVQIAMIYLFTSVYKLHYGNQWLDGSFLFQVLNAPNYSIHPWWLWLRHTPWLVNLATYQAMASEVLFPFWVWFRRTRVFVLVMAVILHIGITLSLNVVYFSEVMISSYVIFLSDDEYAWLERAVIFPVAAFAARLWNQTTPQILKAVRQLAR